MECSFLNLSSRSCSGIFKPVVAYEDNKIDNEHDITSLAEVLKYRGLFFEENKKNLIICETHVTEFGKRWRASEFCSLRYRCKSGRALPRGKINVIQSRYLLEQEGLAVPFGSGKYIY